MAKVVEGGKTKGDRRQATEKDAAAVPADFATGRGFDFESESSFHAERTSLMIDEIR